MENCAYKCTIVWDRYSSSGNSERVPNHFDICSRLGNLSIEMVGSIVFCVIFFTCTCASEKYYTIHLFPGGIVPEATIKTNLINAYNRFLRGKKISFNLGGVRIIDRGLVSSEQISALKISTSGEAGCTPWHMDQLEDGTDNYILTDNNPCNATTVVKQARAYLQRNRRNSGASIVPVGMGNEISSQWLKQTCGPCSTSIGCISGWNWFRI